MNDHELAQALSEGDEFAFEALIDRYYDSIYRFLRQLTRHRETAEDLTQQCLLRAVSKIGTFRGESTLRTWLHRLAFHEYTSWRRKRRFFHPLSELNAVPEPAYGHIEEAEALLSLLHTLPAAHREALLLFHVQELTIEEIAVVTESSVGTVKSRLHHARKRLQSETINQENFCYEK